MDKFYGVQLGSMDYRVASQIGALVNGVVTAYHDGMKGVLVGPWNMQYGTSRVGKITDLINLEAWNEYLLKRVGLRVFDRCDIEIQVDKIRFGTEDKVVDLTENIKGKYGMGNSLFVPKNTVFNDIKGDPAPNQYKKVLCKFKINGEAYDLMYNEHLENNIVWGQVPHRVLECSDRVNKYNPELFADLMKNLPFVKDKFHHVDEPKTATVNLLHLRADNDVCYYWGVVNTMLNSEFKEQLECKYIEYIEQYFDKSDEIVVVSYEKDSKVLQWLKQEGYTYILDTTSDSEIAAIRQLLMGLQYCNGSFIGANGSMMTYILSLKLNIPQYLINLADIKH